MVHLFVVVHPRSKIYHSSLSLSLILSGFLPFLCVRSPTVQEIVALSTGDRSPPPDAQSVRLNSAGGVGEKDFEVFWRCTSFHSLVVESSMVVRPSEIRNDLFNGVIFVLFIFTAVTGSCILCHTAWIFIIVFP